MHDGSELMFHYCMAVYRNEHANCKLLVLSYFVLVDEATFPPPLEDPSLMSKL